MKTVQQPMLGITLILLAYFFFSFIDAGAKWLAIAGLAAMQLAFMRYFSHFVISYALIAKDGTHPRRFVCDKMGWVIIRALTLTFATICNFIALRYIPLTLTSTILFSSPIMVCMLSMPMLGEKVGPYRWSAIVVGFVGILIAIRPFDESFHWAMLLSLVGASGFSFYIILSRKLADVVETDMMQFYTGFVGTIILLPLAIIEWENPTNTLNWIIMFSIGVFGWLGHQLLTNAHRYAPANTLTPFSYSFIIYLTIWSYWVFDHLPDIWTITGAVIITSSSMVIWMREKHLDKIQKNTKNEKSPVSV